jgi:hypothetical protein
MICEAGNTEKLIPIIKKFQDSLVKGLVFSALVPINSVTKLFTHISACRSIRYGIAFKELFDGRVIDEAVQPSGLGLKSVSR